MNEPSLGSLARNHVEGGGLLPSLASLTVSPSTGNLSTSKGEQSLGSLAANHLSGLTIPGSSPSLGSLAASHLKTTNSEHSSSQDNNSNTSSLSLGTLASTHLQGGSKSSLGSLASTHLSAIPTGPSLGSLAAVHLSNQSLGSPFSKSSKAEPVKVVDLTSALMPNSVEPATPAPVLKKGVVQVSDAILAGKNGLFWFLFSWYVL